MIPRIETDRLILRGHEVGDYESAVQMWRDPVVTRFILGGKPSASMDTWFRILRYVGHWQLLGFGFWAVVEKSTGTYIGEVGFADFRREIVPPTEVPELGWSIRSEFHGRGFGTEAVSAAVSWGDQFLHEQKTTCIIDPENAPSLRVAAKCGFHITHEALYDGKKVKVLERKNLKI